MITPEPPAGSEHYREGWRHGYEQAAIDRERSADVVRAVPDTVQAQAREGLPSVPDEMWLTSDWGVIESDGSGAWRTVENGSYVERLPAVRIRLVPDTVQAPAAADLAYARSEVGKWLADGDPYCILPTRTEHIPALLARLDELEGTS